MNKYRLTHYNYKAWCLDEWTIPGEDAKNQEPYWKTVKYPGTLKNAVEGLLDAEIGDMSTGSLKRLLQAVEGAERRILEAVEDLIVERERKG